MPHEAGSHGLDGLRPMKPVNAWRWGLEASGSGPWAPWGKMGHAQTP